MLGQLDTFIAFAVVILGVSLLITVLNQAVVAVLSMRGANLRWGLETLLEHVDPRLHAHAKDISEAVLRHPLISDSTWSKVGRWPIVGRIVSRWQLASAIRVGELKNILEKLATPSPAPPGGAAARAPAAPAAPAWQAALSAALATDAVRASDRLAAARAALGAVAPGVAVIPGAVAGAVAPAAAAPAAAVPGAAAAGAAAPAAVATTIVSPGVATQLQQLVPQVALQFKEAVGDLDLWFDSVMDRVSQRFAARTRLWTVIWAVIVAFVLHLDASRLLDQIRSDPQLRANLVASVDGMSRQAESVIDSAVPNAFDNALKRLHAEDADLKALPAPPGCVRRAAARNWIAQQNLAPKRQEELNTRLEVLIREESKEVLDGLRQSAEGIRKTLDTAGLRIVPDYAEHKWNGWVPDWAVMVYKPPDPEADPPIEGRWEWNKHFFGILFSAMLLSLGAPFWFNVLKQAATLRPIIATKEKGEREQRS